MFIITIIVGCIFFSMWIIGEFIMRELRESNEQQAQIVEQLNEVIRLMNNTLDKD